eukprot:TRINITY_DN29_c0_g2_i14.p1 TRINITY_DN29_c0_g2~~TRINITY_DN29_c0_g2_i14.p1  ORF type:complete len:122 (+),score=10.43 TRINITY_DN29_c0_g2_i14:130-495(+)
MVGSRTCLVCCDIMKNKSEHIVLDEEGVAHGLEDKVLHEGLGRVIVSLQLAHHVHQDAPIEHRVAVDGGDDVRDALEGEGVDLLHDLGGPCICWPSKLRKLCSVLYSLASSPLVAALSNIA